jgi:hypothetical protein
VTVSCDSQYSFEREKVKVKDVYIFSHQFFGQFNKEESWQVKRPKSGTGQARSKPKSGPKGPNSGGRVRAPTPKASAYSEYVVHEEADHKIVKASARKQKMQLKKNAASQARKETRLAEAVSNKYEKTYKTSSRRRRADVDPEPEPFSPALARLKMTGNQQSLSISPSVQAHTSNSTSTIYSCSTNSTSTSSPSAYASRASRHILNPLLQMGQRVEAKFKRSARYIKSLDKHMPIYIYMPQLLELEFDAMSNLSDFLEFYVCGLYNLPFSQVLFSHCHAGAPTAQPDSW